MSASDSEAATVGQASGPKEAPRSSSPGHEADSASGSRALELERLIALKFPQTGRKQRIARALKALKDFRVDFKLDRDTWKWIAEDPDIEDI